ncbi:MAG: hypothetical protein JRK53_00715 [Deltaproteobacteria bacterium]|nr:hypothetical protein [Deltaproteobacteria bacterium]MBW1816108.1 hypothetical protein [Deltaproteobacteria bacterium]MBW2284288.1 hypothetical protein [Deltaproteobacteria bacterium]
MKISTIAHSAAWLIFLAAFSPTVTLGDVIPPEQVDAFAYQMGIVPDMDTFEQNEAFVETSFGGTVAEPCRMADLGFKTARQGERVEVICRKDGQWLGRVLSTGEEKIFKISLDWDKKD